MLSQHQHRRGQQQAALDHRIVAPEDRIREQPAHAGMEYTVSITTDPESSRPKLMPITVITGIMTFFSACLPITMHAGRPLARAVRT